MSENNIEARYWSVAQVARMLGVSVKTIYAMCKRKYLPSLKLGSRVLIHKLNLQQRLEEIEASTRNKSAKNGTRKIVD